VGLFNDICRIGKLVPYEDFPLTENFAVYVLSTLQ